MMKQPGKWTETYLRLSKAGPQQELEPAELETLALAAYLTGRDAEGYEVFTRAHRVYLDENNTTQAVRCAFWLALMFMNAGERARSNGWIATAERILKGQPGCDCSERGLLLLPTALGALSSGDTRRAVEVFAHMEALGEQFNDIDLIALARLGHGQALIRQGQIADGIKLLDETMIIVETRDVFPVVKGIVYCAVIETCRKVWDLARAQEWTSALSRWCDIHSEIVPFKGQCLVRRAEIIQFHGDWFAALAECDGACELLTKPPGEPAAGEALYRRAELHRLLGNFPQAQHDYHEAARRARSPQPGLALLRLEQGDCEAAEASIRQALQEGKDKRQRADILPAAVSILIAAKKTDDAGEAARELSVIAREFDVPYLNAMSAHCEGAVYSAEGKAQLALERFEVASRIWEMLQLPFESARTRELKSNAYRQLNDHDNADAELAAARWTLDQLVAMPDEERIDRSPTLSHNHETHGLSLREVQVLQQIAAGKTNKSVAHELFISERTVDRHVSNIFNKLGVSSRVEATRFAIRNNMVDG